MRRRDVAVAADAIHYLGDKRQRLQGSERTVGAKLGMTSVSPRPKKIAIELLMIINVWSRVDLLGITPRSPSSNPQTPNEAS